MPKYYWDKKEKYGDQINYADQTTGYSQSDSSYFSEDDKLRQEATNNVISRVNAFIAKNNSYVSDYQKRNAGRKYTHEDAFVSDSADWSEKAKKNLMESDREMQDILKYVNSLEGYISPDLASQVRGILSSGRSQMMQLRDAAARDNDYWSSFGSDPELLEKYGSAEGVYGYYQRDTGYRNTYAGKTADELREIAAGMDDGEEKDWLNTYAAGLDYQDLATADIGRLDNIEKRLKTHLSQYNQLGSFASSYATNPNARWPGVNVQENLAEWDLLQAMYPGGGKEIEKYITQNETKRNRAKYIQEGIRLASVGDKTSENYDHEFETYSTQQDNAAYRKPITKYMSDQERKVYNYYYNKFGNEAAQDYLEHIEETLNARKAEEIYATYLEGRKLAEIAYSGIAGIDQFATGVQSLLSFGKDYIPASVTQQVSAKAREDLGDIDLKWYDFASKQWKDQDVFGNSLGQGIYDLGTTAANMAPSILASTVVSAIATPTVGAAVGATLMGASAAGGAYQEALNLGYDKTHARAYSTLVGASEAGLQYLIGGVGKLGSTITGKAAANIAAKFDNAFMRLAVNGVINALSEGAEEYLQEILTPVFKNIALGTDEEINLITEEAIYSFMLGMLTSGFMDASGLSGNKNIVSTLIDMSSKNKKNVQAQEMYGDYIPEIVESGLESPTNTQSYQLADIAQRKTSRGKSLTGYEIRELVNANKAQTQSETYSDALPRAEKMLSDLGVENASKLAKIVAKNASGQQLTKAEKTELVHSEAGVKIAAQLRKKYGTTYEPGEHKAFTVGKEQTAAPAADDSYEVSVDGKTVYNGEEVSIQGISGYKNGKLMLKLSNGQEADASQVSYGSESESLIYNTVANMDISDRSAGIIIDNYLKRDSAISAEEYALGIEEAYRYGQQGIEQSKLDDSEYASKLNPGEQDVVYRQGVKNSGKNISIRQDALKNRTVSKEKHYQKFTKEKNGVKYDDVDLSGKKLNKYQRTSIQLAEFLASLGMDVHVFESQVVNGKHIGENGSYYSADGSIHIDLAAGNRGEGLTAYTLSHELTHFVEDWSPAKFKVFADALFAELGKSGANVDKMIQKKLEILRGKEYTKGMTEQQLQDLAYSEVVAECCETMLTDTDVAARVMEKLKVKDNALYNKVKAFFEKLLTKIKGWMAANKAYLDANPESPIAAEAKKTLKNVQSLADLFAEAAVDAADAFRAAQNRFSTENMQGSADGAVLQSEAATAIVAASAKHQMRTEFEALPKQVMSLSDGAGTLLHSIDGLTPTKITGLSGKTVNGYTGRDVRACAMKISGFTESQIQNVNKFMDSMADFMEEAGVTYKFIGLQDVKDAKLHYTYNSDGSIKSIVLSAMVKNGDYPVNFDLSSICKKREAMSKLIDKLAKRGSLDSGTVKLTPGNIFRINTALKDAGYETACLGCFVESKRYNSLEWAKKFCNKWNAAVKKVNPNATYFGYGDATFTEDSFTLEQAVKIDDAATKYITSTKTERLANALKKYQAKADAGLPLVESFSKAARDRLIKSDTISDELKDKYLNSDVSTWNMADVEFLLENGILPGASLSNKQAVTEMVKSGEAYQHLLRPSDLLTDRGISKLEALPNFHGVLYGHYGSGTPKLMQSYTPYNSEIALLPDNKNKDQTLAEYLYTIAGVRMQSFSDFQIQNIYDYFQMVADLAARKVPAHAYTKEISFAKLLGMTGIKTNLSVMFDIDPMVDKAHAGLTKLNKLVHRGEYAKVVLEDAQGKWVYNIGDYQTQKMFAEAFPDEAKRFLQSIGFADAVKLQSSPGYSANCGIIGVGYSDLGIFAMLDDNRIRYIIPYHASSLPAEIKLATNIALGTDYTPYQNNMKISGIVDRNGNKVNWTIKEAYKRLGSGQAVIDELNEKIRTEGWVVSTTKAQTGHGSYGLYENLQETNDPRQTASNFMDWCIGNGTLPLFYQFASHENYYKLLYDFNVYDCVTEEYAPQQAVTNTYPTMVDGQVQPGNVTDGGFNTEYLQGTIDKQMAFMDEYSRNRDEDLDALAENVENGNYTLHSDRETPKTIRFAQRDTSSVPTDISDFVDEALNIKMSAKPIFIGKMTDIDNKAINRLGQPWKGKYTGVERFIEPRYVRHCIKQHGNAFIEALRGQLHMDSDAIKIALSKLRAGKGQVVEGTYSVRGNPTIVTEIPINGYTLYAEEPINQLSGFDMDGRTIYMKPTSTMALKQNHSPVSIPQRRGGLMPSIDASSRIVNSLLTNSAGKYTEFYGIDSAAVSNPGRSTYGLTVLSTNADALKTLGMPISSDSFHAKVSNPYIVTSLNPLITDDDIKESTIDERIAAVKRAGHDAIVMDYKLGDNYFVMLFDKDSAIKLSDRDSTYIDDIRYQERTDESVSKRASKRLESENAKLREDVAYLKELLKLQKIVTGGRKFSRNSVESASKLLMKNAGAKGNRSELVKLLNDFYAYIANDPEVTWDGVKEKAQPAINWLMNNMVAELDPYAEQILKEIKGNHVYLTEKQKQNIRHKYGSIPAFKHMIAGTVVITDTANTSLDSWWKAMAETYPERFDGSITESDQPEALDAAVEGLRGMFSADFQERAYNRQFIEQDLLHQIYDSYWNLTTLYTVADAKQKEIDQIKSDHTQRMEKLRDSYRKKIELIKQDRRQDYQRMRKKYHDQQAERMEKTKMRHKIRTTVRDLDRLLNRGNKKTNVKEDMKGLVSKSLALADLIFTDHISDDDLIRRGITVSVRTNEAKLLQETEAILEQIYDHGDTLTDAQFTELDAKRAENISKLRDLLAAQRNELLSTPVHSLFSDIIAEYTKLKNSPLEYIRAAYSAETERFLRTYIGETMDGTNEEVASVLKHMRVANMTLEELWKLSNAYTVVLTTVRDANKFHADNMKQGIDQTANKLRSDFGKRKIPEKEFAVAMQKLANTIGWDYEKLYYALDRIGSETFAKLVMNIANSENVVMQDVSEAKAFMLEQVKKYNYNQWKVDTKMEPVFMDNTGKQFQLTIGEAMALYAYSRRNGALDHLEYGGFVFGKNSLTDPKPEDTYKLTKSQLEAITDHLTDEQKQYAEDMQKYLSDVMGGKGNEVSMLLYGIKMFGEKNYFPLHVSGIFKEQARESEAKAAAGFASMSNAGFTHAQQKNAKAPIILDAFNDVWVDHVNEMSRYHGTVPALEDFRRVMNYKSYSDNTTDSISVSQALSNAYGRQALNYFNELYKEANTGAIQDRLQQRGKKWIGLFRKGSVAYSLSVAIQQPSSIERAKALIDRKYFGKVPFMRTASALTEGFATAAIQKWNTTYADTYSKMMQYAPGVTMAKEIGGFDTASGASIRTYLADTEKTFGEKVKTDKHGKVIGAGKAAYYWVDNNRLADLPNFMDKVAWCEIWKACERETVAKHKDLKPGSDEFLKIVGDRFTEVIRATQVYDSIFAKSPLLKSKNMFVQGLVSFMNEPNVVANMAEKILRDFGRGKTKEAVTSFVSLAQSIALNAALSAIIYAMRDDDEDETYIEKYIEAVTGNLLNAINPLQYMPVGRDIWSIVQGHSVERQDMAIATDAINALLDIVQYGMKDTSNMTEAQLIEFNKKVTKAKWEIVDSIGAVFGLPVKNIRREVNAFKDHYRIASANRGKTTKISAKYAISDAASSMTRLGSETAKGDKLYDAIISGDTVYADRLKATYKDEDAYHTAVRKALRDNDPRIREAAQAQLSGDPSARKKIQDAIVQDGFDRLDVFNAISAEVNDLKGEEEDTSTPKEKANYTPDDFVQEFINGDTKALDEIKADIVATHQLNGKTDVEARKQFASSVVSSAKDAYLESRLDATQAKNLLLKYSGMKEEDVADRVSYWDFLLKNPDYDHLSESKVIAYNEYAKPANISLKVYDDFVQRTKDLTTIRDKYGDVETSKQDQVIEVIDSLPLTWRQKDALYLSAYAESGLEDVPWR